MAASSEQLDLTVDLTQAVDKHPGWVAAGSGAED